MTALDVLLPLGSSLVSFVFAAMVLDQWAQRRHSFQLVWAVGLLWYGIAAGTEFLGGAFGWNPALYRTWYLVGAVLVPAYLGAGTLYLLSKTRFGYLVAAAVAAGGLFSVLAIPKYPGSATAAYVTLAVAVVAAAAIAFATARRRELQGHVAMAFLLAGTLSVAVLVWTAKLSGAFLDPATHIPVATAIPGYLRVSSFPFNAGGGIALVFGALYSAYVYMPKKRAVPARLGVLAIVPNFFVSLPGAVSALARGKLNSRVSATILIAVGASVPGVTSSLNRAGVTWPFFLGEFLGVLIIFVGFLVSEEVFRNVRLGVTLWSRSPSTSLEREIG
ncbi:MAG TPA: hypothetical protein VFL27_07365 [Candidatus Dormibacteraeota bacterium]|nr:hypothetical protein [Candidatus Dormibacteraeota bacterium]